MFCKVSWCFFKGFSRCFEKTVLSCSRVCDTFFCFCSVLWFSKVFLKRLMVF